MFGIFKKEWKLINQQEEYTTNWEVPNLIDYLDKIFMVICEETVTLKELNISKYVINGACHICLDKKIAESLALDARNILGKKYTYYQMPLCIFLEDIIAGEYNAIILYGMPEENGKKVIDKKIIGKEIVQKYKDIIKVQSILKDIKFGNLDKQQGYEQIKEIEMFFIGNKILLELPKDEEGKMIIPKDSKVILRKEDISKNTIPLFLDEISFKDKDNNLHTDVKIYVSEYSAKMYGGKDENICKLPLWKIKEMCDKKIIIEPHRNWWVEF